MGLASQSDVLGDEGARFVCAGGGVQFVDELGAGVGQLARVHVAVEFARANDLAAAAAAFRVDVGAERQWNEWFALESGLSGALRTKLYIDNAENHRTNLKRRPTRSQERTWKKNRRPTPLGMPDEE